MAQSVSTNYAEYIIPEFINGSMTVQEFTIIRKDDETVTVYLGDPSAPESDAEFIMQVCIHIINIHVFNPLVCEFVRHT